MALLCNDKDQQELLRSAIKVHMYDIALLEVEFSKLKDNDINLKPKKEKLHSILDL